MKSSWIVASLERGIKEGCADDIEEGLCNLADGTCDDVGLIPVLERVAAANHFWYFDDNGSGGFPHATGNPIPFGGSARLAIENIRENAKLGSDSRAARALKSADTDEVEAALAKLATDSLTDESLFPILEKIARKDTYESYAYVGGRSITHRLGQAAKKAIQRIRANRIAAGLPTKVCSICDTIPDRAVANTGRDEHFEKPITLLKRLDLDRDDDLWECPECGSLFHWNDDRSFTGSGNNDEEVLNRLLPNEAEVVREILHGTRPTADPAGIVEGLGKVDPVAARKLAETHMLRHDRALARQLVPELIRAASGGAKWCSDFLMRFASDPDDARLLLKELEDARPALPDLQAYARMVTCSICSAIPTYPPFKARRDALPPNLAKLKQLGAKAGNDVWECPECDYLLHWESKDGVEGGLTRVTGVLADSLRKCMHDAVDDTAIGTIFACGLEWQDFLFAHAMRNDHQLVMLLVPHMVKSLALSGERWLHDALSEIARDPYGAAAVRTALAAKIERPNKLIQSLAAQVRGEDRSATPGKSSAAS